MFLIVQVLGVATLMQRKPELAVIKCAHNDAHNPATALLTHDNRCLECTKIYKVKEKGSSIHILSDIVKLIISTPWS